jgi:hypothetical protein
MKNASTEGKPASELIDKRIAELGDWRGETLSNMRKLIKEADPDVVEEWKWMGTPVWSHDGIICTGESYKSSDRTAFICPSGNCAVFANAPFVSCTQCGQSVPNITRSDPTISIRYFSDRTSYVMLS